MDSVGVLSPCEKKGKKYHHISGLEKIDYTDLSKYSFINSGMCTKADVFHKINYDECLFLDFLMKAYFGLHDLELELAVKKVGKQS